MSLPALYVSRLLPDPVMAAIRERFHLINAPEDAHLLKPSSVQVSARPMPPSVPSPNPSLNLC